MSEQEQPIKATPIDIGYERDIDGEIVGYKEPITVNNDPSACGTNAVYEDPAKQSMSVTPVTVDENYNCVTCLHSLHNCVCGTSQGVVEREEINTAQRLYYTKWHKSGVDAKTKGFSRDVTPYYNNSTADYFFHCGFDGVKLEQAIETMTMEMQSINKDSEANCCVMNGVDGIHNTHCIHFKL